MKPKSIDVEHIRTLLDYNPEVGGSCLVWKVSPRYGIAPGDRAGSLMNHGYWGVRVEGKTYLAHRLVWAIVKGEDPGCAIDHINGKEAGNHIENLRLAPRGQSDNSQNSRLQKSNSTGYKGVHREKRGGKFVAQISKDKKRIWIGEFDTPEEAYAAYLEAKANLHTFNPTVR